MTESGATTSISSPPCSLYLRIMSSAFETRAESCTMFTSSPKRRFNSVTCEGRMLCLENHTTVFTQNPLSHSILSNRPKRLDAPDWIEYLSKRIDKCYVFPNSAHVFRVQISGAFFFRLSFYYFLLILYYAFETFFNISMIYSSFFDSLAKLLKALLSKVYFLHSHSPPNTAYDIFLHQFFLLL